jgi:hypothetical protein
MALTTPTAMACRTDAPAEKAAEVPVAVVGGLAVAYPRAVVASTRRRGERP